MDVLPEGLRLERGEVYRPVAEDVSDAEDVRYAAAVRREPVDGRQRVTPHGAVHPAAVHVGELHPGRRLRHEAGPLGLVGGVDGTCFAKREGGRREDRTKDVRYVLTVKRKAA